MALPRTVLAGARDAATRALAHVHRSDDGDGGGTGPASSSQTLTVERPAERVLAALRDPEVLSRLLGDVGTVSAEGSRYTWALGADHVVTTLSESVDGLTFARTTPEDVAEPEDDTEGGTARAVEVWAEFTVTPTPDGTRSQVRARSQLPGGTAEFTVLYRLRALLQTGEIPTLGPQPTTREEDR
ncbi:hypothetical protein AB2L27_08240 [Kineococcus sp. LSe6-4]|uniref:SRPBCC family protein n=1 Tax=Kineococcus halophytocola TaxID=3234027 RepID=A0ABV4H1Q2_9ACTN